jgi:RNA 2',3'-cyclic 3'-phosphodiesterase
VRLFVAVWPPDHVLDLVANLPRPDLVALRWTTRDQWHVTMRFLGEVPDAGPVVAALGSVSCGPLRAEMGPTTGWFPGNRVLQVPVTGLQPLESELARALRPVCGPGSTDQHPYRGHLTLARVTSRSRLVGAEIATLSGFALDAAWFVDAFSLVLSKPASRGSRYSNLATFSVGS